MELVRQIAPDFPAGNPLDFRKVAAQTGLTLDDFDAQFGLKAGTFARMQTAAADFLPRHAKAVSRIAPEPA